MKRERNNLGEYIKIYDVDEDYFNCIDTPNKAYILGFIYADGGVKNNILTITQSGDIEKNILPVAKNSIYLSRYRI